MQEPPLNMPTICVIDDDQQTAEMLAEFVRLSGFESIVYTRAEDFFKQYERCADTSAMLLDLNMPGMDGIEVMRRLALHGDAPPLILISGYDKGVLHSAEYLAQAHSLKILASLTKPISIIDLQSILETLLNKSSSTTPVSNNSQPLALTAGDLEYAIAAGDLILHYQPQIDIRTGSLTGIEALCRWQHAQYGLIFPDAFIPLAEANGLMSALTSLVIRMVVEQTSLWKKSGFMAQVSVNISADNITSLALPEQLSTMLKDNRLDPAILTLEITESALMGELVTSLDILTRIRMKGIELSIDDFGTGYSSLSQLHRIPFTELKIDKSFVLKMARENEARAIVKTCIMLGHELNMMVVAEGVETAEIFELLKSMGCDIAQGYHIAKPMPANDLLPWARTNSKKHN